VIGAVEHVRSMQMRDGLGPGADANRRLGSSGASGQGGREPTTPARPPSATRRRQRL